ncbi:hypothetical protein ACHQM5_022680 [Ranunculus cassubicifolius]
MSFPITPHVIIPDDEDDEFDWEAAVKEIDVACQRPSSIAVTSNSNLLRPKQKENFSNLKKQSTLDKFFQNRQSQVEPIREIEIEVVGRGGDCDNSTSAITSCHCQIDLEAAKTWIYPVNIPRREYQLSITKTALFANTLVALPTGLGKTFIAAVVMYNYFRWFPEGKIVFTAPSRPLVLQQIEACHNIVGIPQEWTIDLTGQTSSSKRAGLWETKRVFFVTPQVLENDIQSGTCVLKYLVCLVIDEAHRATGNYSYCVVIRELMAAQLHFRILALTATPGSKQQAIQYIINNLQISKLEYRNESDPDVSPYVHNRKLDLIKVAMGKDAINVGDLLLDVIRPLASKLSGLGVLPNRDCRMWSPIDILNGKKNFLAAPPSDVPQMKYGDVGACLNVLVTLYHVRKLLSSHGIPSAYEMLDRKLKEGSLRYIGNNEIIWKIKSLMEQNQSHGASSPKLLKMKEVLVDHFKSNDPKNSRVIIFSNYRESVRGIMTSLTSIGDFVKATEFIGQSSGKTLKGQTQKMQQAVLQKFRDGGYNIIVATSIGEEGLDIMEVDLVICFDANISPLRMIQRMGRTGRKHDGRVVILACEGSELQGYTRKLGCSNAINKHMRNGGINSFDFHSSPRMIPHICKPEIQFVEFKIEQFVPRGKKIKHNPITDHTFKDKLSDAEAELVAKYFSSSSAATWKPSLNAFPHFQAFPSRVHKVMHSFRTSMLISTMQHLQALPFSFHNESLPVEVLDKTSSDQCLGAKSLAKEDTVEKDLVGLDHSLGAHSENKISEAEIDEVTSRCTEDTHTTDSPHQKFPMHCFLFETTCVSVDPLGMVSITFVPSLPFVDERSSLKTKQENSTDLLNTVKHKNSPTRTPSRDNIEFSVGSKALANPSKSSSVQNCLQSSSPRCNFELQEEHVLHEFENVVSTPSPKRSCIDSEVVVVVETPASTTRNSIPLASMSTKDVKDIEMSPRLTNMAEEGVVPESPLGDQSSKWDTFCRDASSEPSRKTLFPNCSREDCNEIPKAGILHSVGSPNFQSRRQSLSPVLENDENCNSHVALPCVNGGENSFSPPINEGMHTPLVNLTNSCSNDWRLSSGEASKSIEQPPKFKRLRKHGDSSKRIVSNTLDDKFVVPKSNLIDSTIRQDPAKRIKSKRKIGTEAKVQARVFIEEEAEVSADADVSDDEDIDNSTNSTDDSFIDDRINPTVDSTQAEALRSDMMAIYRRSLLTQSPMESPPCTSTDMHTIVEPDETGSCSSGKISHHPQTPQAGLRSANQSAVRCSNLCQMDSVISIPSEGSGESRKRKLLETSIQPKRLFESEFTLEKPMPSQPEHNAFNGDMFSDDQFYAALDLDELEAQATALLRSKTQLSMDNKRHTVVPDPLSSHKPELSNSPSFDLGI